MTREAGKMNEKILALEEYIRRHKAGIKAKQARGRETQLKKLTPIAAPQAGKSLNMSLQTSQRAGDRVLDITGLSVAYEKNTVFEDVSLELRRGHRIALLGRNGVGKTSLLKAITGEVPYQGDLRLGANVKIGYYSQEHEDIGLGNNVKDIMDELRYCSDLDDPQIRTVLARFGFRGDDVFKPIAVLSGGEKSRLALCKLFLVQGNLLLLDEPTNHLDMDTREVLEEALLNYNGTMITVSHDRYFINRMVNRIALLTPKGIRVIEGDYTAYRDTMEKEKEESNLKPDEGDKIAKSYRLESKNNKRREKKVKQLEESIENTKMLLQELESKLESLTGDYELTLKLHNEYQMLQNEHDDLMQEWLAMND